MRINIFYVNLHLFKNVFQCHTASATNAKPQLLLHQLIISIAKGTFDDVS